MKTPFDITQGGDVCIQRDILVGPARTVEHYQQYHEYDQKRRIITTHDLSVPETTHHALWFARCKYCGHYVEIEEDIMTNG